MTLSECVKTHPDFARCWYGLGLMKYSLGKTEEAQKALKKLQSLDKDLARQLEAQLEQK